MFSCCVHPAQPFGTATQSSLVACRLTSTHRTRTMFSAISGPSDLLKTTVSVVTRTMLAGILKPDGYRIERGAKMQCTRILLRSKVRRKSLELGWCYTIHRRDVLNRRITRSDSYWTDQSFGDCHGHAVLRTLNTYQPYLLEFHGLDH